MEVVIRNKRYRLDQAQTLGAGGEGTVIKADIDGIVAVKVYHQPTPLRERKLKSFVAKNWSLPKSKIALPIDIAFDAAGKNTVGLTMAYMGTGFEELISLSNKKYRTTYGVNARQVVEIFLDGAQTIKQIHNNGLVIGDLNDMNALFRGNEMLFIDVDAWQFEQFPCLVGSEQFLSPELYGIDLTQRAAFKPHHDIYSFWVLLFKSLYLVHPYGGIHKDYKKLTQRARARVSVYDTDVTYPKIALPLDTFGENQLTECFRKVFVQGEKITIDETIATLNGFLSRLDKQGNYIAKPVITVAPKPLIGVVARSGMKSTLLFQFAGQLVESLVQGETIYAIAYEQGQVVLYKHKLGQLQRKELFAEPNGGARYQMQGDNLFVNLRGSNKVMVLDMSSDKPVAVGTFETDVFLANRRAMFRTTNKGYYRIINGMLMRGKVDVGAKNFDEELVLNAMTNQTWFTAQDVVSSDGKFITALCGFNQVMKRQLFWMLWGNQSFDLSLPELELNEALVDVSVKFSSQGVLIRRHTQQQGVDYIRAELVDNAGQVVFAAPKMRLEDHPAGSLHGQAYSTNVLLHPTDSGILQEKLREQTFKTFDVTQGEVATGDALYIYQKGLLVVGDSYAKYIQLS